MADLTSQSNSVEDEIQSESEKRARVERAVQDSQRLLQTIIDSIEGEVFVKDKNGIYLYVNRAYGKAFKVDPAEVIGKDDYFVLGAEEAAMLHTNDRWIMAGKRPSTSKKAVCCKASQPRT